MSHSIKDFDFSQLSPSERILLAQDLWDSAHEEARTLSLTAEQHAEVSRRLAALDAGTMPTSPWDEVRQRLSSHK